MKIFLMIIGSFITLAVGVFLIIDCIWRLSSWFKSKRKASGEAPRLSFKQFKNFYLLNPHHWSWVCEPDGVVNYIKFIPTNQFIWFKTIFDYVWADIWIDHLQAEETKYKDNIKSAENMAKMLSYIQKDAETVEARAKEEFDKQQKDLEKILANLPKSKSLGS